MHSFTRWESFVLWLLLTPSGWATMGLVVSAVLVLIFIWIRRQLRTNYQRRLAVSKAQTQMETEIYPPDSEHWTRAINAALELLMVTRSSRHVTDWTNIAAWAAINATVTLRAGTRNGLTQWIAQTAKEYDLILVDTAMTADNLTRTQNPRAYVMPITDIDTAKVARFRNIYVDGASQIKPEYIAAMYAATAHSVEQRWFLLG